MRRAKLLLIAGLSLAGLAGADAVAAGEVYQWKDANGVTHYSQTPPPKGQYQQRQITDKGAAAPQRVEAATARAQASAPPRISSVLWRGCYGDKRRAF